MAKLEEFKPKKRDFVGGRKKNRLSARKNILRKERRRKSRKE